MKEMTVQKTGGGQLFVYIPKTIERHFGIREGQKVYADWDETDPENPKLLYYLRKPPRQENGGHIDADCDAEVL